MKAPSDSPSSLLDRFFNLIESASASDKLLLRIAIFVVIASGIWLALSFNTQLSEDTPTKGGTFVEGVVGTPRYINPALAITRADQDLTSLVYSGLVKINPSGELINDIAENITVSKDGLTYNISLRKDVTFHDNTSLTADDVVYTIQLIQDPDLKSPLRGNWTDVTMEKINDFELNIILEEPYTPFIENFTLGIMPAHAWAELPIEQLPFSNLNSEPIGSGPFMVTDSSLDASGLINHYTLSAFEGHSSNPRISTIEFNFYQNEDLLLSAIQKEEIDTTAYIPPSRILEVPGQNYRLIEESLPRTFGVFFNQNRSVALRDASVREALSLSLNREEIVDESFFGYGVPIDTPTTFPNTELESDEVTDNVSSTTNQDKAVETLKEGGWSKNSLGLWEKEIDKQTVTLRVVLRTSNTPLFESLSSIISKQWTALGVEVITEQFEQTGLVQSVIRPRDFEALLFGHDITRSHDLYPVWHSSQKDDPGLNISQYANIAVDDLLTEARSEQTEALRIEKLVEASKIIKDERPAVFIAQPTLSYVVSNDIVTSEMHNLGRSSDRFSNIAQWHTESEHLWPVFRNDM